MLLTNLGSYIPALVSIATCAIVAISYRYFCNRDNYSKQQAASDVPPGAIPLNDYFNSLGNTLKTSAETSMTQEVEAEFSPTQGSQFLITQATPLLKVHGIEPAEIAEKMEKESSRKHAKHPNRRRWSTGQFTELNL